MTTRDALKTACLGLLLMGVSACNSTGSPVPTAPAAPPAVSAQPLPAPRPPIATSRLFGTVTEMTANGPIPVAGVYIEYCGYDAAETAADGSYQLFVPDGVALLYVRKVAGFRDIAPVANVAGETRYDLLLVRE